MAFGPVPAGSFPALGVGATSGFALASPNWVQVGDVAAPAARSAGPPETATTVIICNWSS
eukprot:4803811-Lingulodinium_polyedra.AAC.1